MPSIRRLSRERLLRHVLVGLIALILAVGCDRIVSAPTRTPSPSPTAIVIPTPSPSDRVLTLPTPPSRDLEDLYTRLTPTQRPPISPTPAPPRNYQVGITQQFTVSAPTPASPSAVAQVPARLVQKTAHSYWYVEDGANVSLADIQSAAAYFETQIYPVEHQLFGWDIPPGIDSDPRITILIGTFPVWGLGVDFSLADSHPRWVAPGSNERKVVYVTSDSFRPDQRAFRSGIAVSLARIVWETLHPYQDLWVKLGPQAVATEEVSGTTDDILDPNAIKLFGLHPEVQLNSYSSNECCTDATYAADYLFAKYVADRFDGASIFPRVFSDRGRGIAAYDSAFRSYFRPTTFNDVFADWVAANALSDYSLDDGHFGYRSKIQVNPSVTPGPVHGTSVAGKATQYGTTYYQVQPTAAAKLTFTGDSTVPVIAANPHGGRFEWWGNRGDFIDSRLTRNVDLRAVPSATLRFWTWFDIEKDFDYAYVEASTDKGATWRTLSTADTTKTNPNDLNLGDGFTGKSGSAPPSWVQETVDLTPFAGREILLRFEYVTNVWLLGDGFVVDGVEIPEIGFRDSTDSDNGWVAEGFVRTDNVAPQPWLVEVLTHDPSNPVRRLTIKPDGTGSLPIQAGQSVIVAVAGLSPNTTQRSQFQLSLTAR